MTTPTMEKPVGLNESLDDILTKLTTEPDHSATVPGVVATVTDRNETIYQGAAGYRSLDSPQPMTADTVFAMFSTTKAITGTAVLQCVEEGLLDLDAPAAEYLPEFGRFQVIDGFDAAGEPILRAPRRPITTRMLMLHTAGFGYSFFNETYHRLSSQHGVPSIISATSAALSTPLLFDPGERWHYGSNIDWAGRVIEAIRGERLGDIMAKRIFEPLDMTDTAFVLTDSMSERRAAMHQRQADGTLVPTDFVLPQEPEVHMGGHGLYSTVGDYSKFLRMWLNDGAGANGTVLSSETVAMAVTNGLSSSQQVTMLPGVEPELTHDAELFPGVRKSWALTFMVNDEDAPTGRPAGSIGWAGLANLFYWIDKRNGLAGFWATQILPFGDPASVLGYLDFESAVYSDLSAGSGNRTVTAS